MWREYGARMAEGLTTVWGWLVEVWWPPCEECGVPGQRRYRCPVCEAYVCGYCLVHEHEGKQR